MNKDIFSSSLIILFFSYALYLSRDYREQIVAYPRWISIIGIIFCFGVIIRSLIKKEGDRSSISSVLSYIKENKLKLFKISSALIMVLIYSNILVRLGYFVSTVLFLFVTTSLIKVKVNIKILFQYLIIAFLITGVFYYVFGELVGVYLPTGMFF